jgi:tRNA dimethylallyltransferase
VRPGELPPLIVICGPTATGKTGLSLELAETVLGAEIIGADSRQVYRGMDIGTAKVSRVDRARVPHHGLDLVDPDQPFTAADFRRHAMAALSGIRERRGVALLVGGTGLYLRAVARGLPLDAAGHHPGLRVDLELRLAAGGLPSLVEELKRRAPTVAQSIDLSNHRRVVRALERATLYGDVAPPRPEGYPAPVLWLGLRADPVLHRGWIAQRVLRQFEGGLLDEATRLAERYPPSLAPFTAMGYREAFDVLAGVRAVQEAVEITMSRTWQYARRQRTWFRTEPDVTWLAPGREAFDAAGPLVAAFLERANDPYP